MGKRCGWESLPDELVCLVLSAVPVDHVAIAARTCRSWFACCPAERRRKLSLRGACSSVALLRWALADGYRLDENTCAMAAALGNLPVLRWAREQGCPWDSRTCTAAAEGGDLRVLRWAQRNGCPVLDGQVVSTAARRGNLAVLKWCYEGGARAALPFHEAARNGHLAVVQWLAERFTKGSEESWLRDSCRQQRALLKWALEQEGGSWHRDVFPVEWLVVPAIDGGHLEVLKWLVEEQQCSVDKRACTTAAQRGQLEVLKWLREERGWPWDQGTCSAAAQAGHLEVLQWARENGCPWNEETTEFAAAEGHVEVVEWARERGCPCSESTWKRVQEIRKEAERQGRRKTKDKATKG